MDIILIKPIPVVERDTRSSVVLPAGAVVEISNSGSSFFVAVERNGHGYSVLREDLLEACTWEDVERIGLGEVVYRYVPTSKS